MFQTEIYQQFALDNHENYKIYAGPYNEETEIEEHFTPKNLETLLSFQVNNIHKCSGVLVTSLYALAVRRCTELLHDEKHKHKVVLMNEIKSTLLSSVGTVIDKFVKVPGTKQLKLLLVSNFLLNSEFTEKIKVQINHNKVRRDQIEFQIIQFQT